MSGTTQAAPLTDNELVDLRRFCGFPAYGLGPTLDPFNRTFVMFAAFEFRSRNLQNQELVVVRARMAAIAAAEIALEGASTNLDTDQASVWIHNKNEVGDRSAFLDQLRRRLCQFLGGGIGPELRSGSNTIRNIV